MPPTIFAFATPQPLLSSPPPTRPSTTCPPRRRVYTPRSVAVSPGPQSHLSPTLDFLPTHLITVLTHSNLPPRHLLSAITLPNGILSPFRPLSAHAFEASVRLPSTANIDALRATLNTLGHMHSADIVLQEASTALEPKRLAVFDLDSTLIAQETIDELAAMVNLENHVKQITKAAMNGEIGFREALARRVGLLKGLRVSQLDRLKESVIFTPGARELIRVLAKLGCRTAVVSGGFHFLADHVREVLGLDSSHANRLEVDGEGRLTGRTVGDVVDAEFKESTLRGLAAQEGLRREQIMAVGDGSNDLLMIGSAGLGVAFNAKPIVQNKAKARVNLPSLRNVLYLLRMTDARIDSLLV